MMFKLLTNFGTLRDLNVINCPVELGFSSMNLFVAEVLIKFPVTTRFCKIEIQDKSRIEAVHLANFKWKKSEELRIEEERKKAEEEAKAAEGEDGG